MVTQICAMQTTEAQVIFIYRRLKNMQYIFHVPFVSPQRPICVICECKFKPLIILKNKAARFYVMGILRGNISRFYKKTTLFWNSILEHNADTKPILKLLSREHKSYSAVVMSFNCIGDELNVQ